MTKGLRFSGEPLVAACHDEVQRQGETSFHQRARRLEDDRRDQQRIAQDQSQIDVLQPRTAAVSQVEGGSPEPIDAGEIELARRGLKAAR